MTSTPLPRTAAPRAAVLGHPIAYSLSPVLHSAAYAALGLDTWRYDAFDVTEEQLAGFLAGLDSSWAGLSLTMPLKHAVLPLLDHVEPLAEVVGAVNTVLFQHGKGRPVLTGANTDVHGIVAALSAVLASGASGASGSSGSAGGVRRTAAVVGAGATAASALAALAQLGCTTPVVYVRSLARVGGLMRAAHRMGVEPRYALLPTAAAELPRADLVVSTLPPYAADELAGALGERARAGSVGAGGTTGAAPGVLLDVVYDPRPTALSVAWSALGGVVVPGEQMLLHQAAEQVRLMTGHPGPVEEMARALEAALR